MKSKPPRFVLSAGSIPISSANRYRLESILVSSEWSHSRALWYDARLRGDVAQLVEQRTHKPRVGGSIPPIATKFSAGL
jgi:hypothetical protein